MQEKFPHKASSQGRRGAHYGGVGEELGAGFFEGAQALFVVLEVTPKGRGLKTIHVELAFEPGQSDPQLGQLINGQRS